MTSFDQTQTTDAPEFAIETKESASVPARWPIFVLVAATAVVAIAVGLATFAILKSLEKKYISGDFYSVTTTAFRSAQMLARYKLTGAGMVMAQVAATSWPNATDWPFVWIDGYWTIAASIAQDRMHVGMHLAPLVQPEQAADFEAFAYSKFREVFGNDSYMGNHSHFGEGIWVEHPSIDAIGHRYNDTTGVSIQGSPYDVLVPILQHSLVDSPQIMMNAHGYYDYGQAIDVVINCTNGEGILYRGDDHVGNCQAVNSSIVPKTTSMSTGPRGNIVTPIFPANDPDTLVGFILGSFFWKEFMISMFNESLGGIDCVFVTGPDEFHTYAKTETNVVYLGKGDLHNPVYDSYGTITQLFDRGPDISCYPNDDFVSMYLSRFPLTVTLISAGIIVFVSVFSFVFGRRVRRGT